MMNQIQIIVSQCLSALYQYLGASLIMAFFFMFFFKSVQEKGVKKCVQDWWNGFTKDSIFRSQFVFVLFVFMILFRTVLCRDIWNHPLSDVFGGWILYSQDGLNIEAIENIVLMIPVTFFYLGYIKKKSAKIGIKLYLMGPWFAFIFSCAIECCQLLFKLGTFQFSDVIWNTTGGIVGAIFFSLFARFTF